MFGNFDVGESTSQIRPFTGLETSDVTLDENKSETFDESLEQEDEESYFEPQQIESKDSIWLGTRYIHSDYISGRHFLLQERHVSPAKRITSYICPGSCIRTPWDVEEYGDEWRWESPVYFSNLFWDSELHEELQNVYIIFRKQA